MHFSILLCSCSLLASVLCQKSTCECVYVCWEAIVARYGIKKRKRREKMRKDLSLQSEDRRMSESDGRQIRISSSGTCFFCFNVLPLGRVARYHNKHPTIQPNIRLRSSCLLVSINRVRFSQGMLNKCTLKVNWKEHCLIYWNQLNTPRLTIPPMWRLQTQKVSLDSVCEYFLPFLPTYPVNPSHCTFKISQTNPGRGRWGRLRKYLMSRLYPLRVLWPSSPTCQRTAHVDSLHSLAAVALQRDTTTAPNQKTANSYSSPAGCQLQSIAL